MNEIPIAQGFSMGLNEVERSEISRRSGSGRCTIKLQ